MKENIKIIKFRKTGFQIYSEGGITVNFFCKWCELRMKERRVQQDTHINQLVRQWTQGHLAVVVDYLAFVY